MVTKVTHPLITFHKKILTLPVLVKVRGITHEPQHRALGHKTIYAPKLNNLSRTVVMKKFLHRQPPCPVRHGLIQDLHAKEDPPGVWGDLSDGQS